MDLSLLPGWHRRVLFRSVVGTFGRLVEVEGAENLAAAPAAHPARPSIIALNHSNSFEALLVPAVLAALRRGRLVHFLADWMFLEIPLLGWLLRQGEPIPVFAKRARFGWREDFRRERLRQSVLDRCLALLAAGESIGIFPEGTRNPDPARLLRARSGLAELALRSGAPVLPAGLRYPAAARLGRAPRLGRIVLAVGAPLTFEAEREELANAPERRREIARLVAARTMAALAGLSGKTYPRNPNRPPLGSGRQDRRHHEDRHCRTEGREPRGPGGRVARHHGGLPA